MDILGIVVTSTLILLIIYMGYRQRNNEKRTWNNGISPWSGDPWVCFDMDSSGGRLYHDKTGNSCSISYSIDK